MTGRLISILHMENVLLCAWNSWMCSSNIYYCHEVEFISVTCLQVW